MAIRHTHLSYYSRAMMVVGASFALITILATVVAVRQERIVATDELRERLVRVAEQQALAVGGSLRSLNADAIRTELGGLARDPDFLAATVFDGWGRSIVRIGPEDVADQPTEQSRAAIVVEEGGQLKPIGALSVVFSLERSRAAEREAARKALILGLAQLAAVLAASAFAVRTVTKELGVSEERLRGVMDNVTDGIITINDRGSIESVNSAAQHIFGYSAGQLIGKDVGTLVPELDRAHQESYAYTGQSKALGVGAREVVGRHKDGNSIPLELAVSEMWFSGEQKFVGVAHDTTARKAVEQRLRQAQKMEATGQFTGGIAHDFNNLLTVIMGNAETLTKALVGNPRLMSVATQLSIAAQRGADLTRSLLAFSRKLVLQPAVTDVDQLVSRMDELLRRTLGEHIHIKVVTCSGLWFAIVDPAHLEAAILNLAVNGRDAMPQGGELTIATGNAELDRSYAEQDEGLGVGSYVMISVTDTGAGMTPDVAGRAFEPFFTTKEVGKGTGLGLSMVYGFVKQSNGHIKIDSEAGRGTTVRLYLPRSLQADAPSVAPNGGPECVGGAETILVVEDDPMVHTYVTRQIQSLGYRVLSARSGVAALDVLRQAEPIDLLFTDVVMPGAMDGPELVVEALRLRPDLRVLYTSGYTENSGMRRRRLGPDDELLSKPYRREDLAARLRKVLDHAADEGRCAPLPRGP